MKNLIIKLIKLYQQTPLACHQSCKYQPTCSNYAIGVYNEYGCIKGTYLTIKRILKCNPWSKGGYDPIPVKNNRHKLHKKEVNKNGKN